MANTSVLTSEQEEAYRLCEALAHQHYENFPVASRLLPKPLRRPIAVIYSFARLADDIADEGDASKEVRLQQLDFFWQSLENLRLKIPPKEPVFVALADVLKRHPTLPLELFFDLLRAFKQDVVKQDYANNEEILEYCQYSANPIGRLLLHLKQEDSPENLALSDKVCTALQLINFLQDLQSDLQIRNRCYLPNDALQKIGLNPHTVLHNANNPSLQTLIQQQLTQAENLLKAGRTLPKRLKGLFAFEIQMIVASGKRMLTLLKQRRSIFERPKLRALDKLKILLRV